MRIRRVLKPGLLLSLVVGVCCTAAAQDAALVAEREPLTGMNPFVLTSLVSSKLVVEIDWVEGSRPSDRSVRAIGDVLREHCEEGKQIEIRLDDEIPRSVWVEAPDRSGLEELVAHNLDGDPADWRRAELLYVLFVPDGGPWYEGFLSGVTDRITFDRQGRVMSVRTVLLFTDEMRRDATLWITMRKVERATVVHELGHVLGLVSNSDHVQPKHPRHCRTARCVMHRPGVRAALVNGLPAFFAGRIPSRYGPRCRRDIADAKQAWDEQSKASPGFVRDLITERLLREKQEAEAWKRLRRP